jgi:hypothetical protein
MESYRSGLGRLRLSGFDGVYRSGVGGWGLAWLSEFI